MQDVEFINYLIKSSICLIFFYSFYLLMLKNQHCFRFNRFYLLSSLLLSMILPLIKVFTLSVNSTSLFDPSILIMPEVIVIDQGTPKSATNWFNLFYIIYGLGIFFIILRFTYQVLNILNYIIKNKKRSTKKFGYFIIDTNGEMPTSSFFNYIFWDNTQHLPSSDKAQILRHERVHVFEHHSIDIVLLKIFNALFWFNPVVWFIKKSIIDNHEYMADSKAFYELRGYKKLLAKQALTQQGIPIAHSFKSAGVFRRLKMLNSHNKPIPFYKYMSVVLVFSFMLFTMSFSTEKISDWKIEDSLLKNNTVNVKIATSDEVFTIVEQPAFPEGGMATFYEYIAKKIIYPKSALEENIKGRVFIEFIIEKNGTISNTKVLKGIHPECDIIALKAVSDAPNWNPGKQNGKAVKQKIVLPINFDLL